ncbi:MAG: alpha/beta hydrolase [Dehalococcoidia bacterium]|nr:alpha/beta hydrolase [Dehalococcoidia bacterium]
MPFAPINGIHLYYEVQGKGPPLVFAHGSGGNHLSWWQQIPFFSRHYKCITFDHRSFGLSQDNRESEGRRAFADDLKGLLDHLGIDQVAIVGHSMGVRTGVGFTMRNPGRVKGLVLSGSNGGAVNEETYIARGQRQESTQPLAEGSLRALSPGFVTEHPEMAFLYRQIMQLNPSHPRDFLAAPPVYRGSTHERLVAAGAPILYILGEEDALALHRGIEIAASLIPQARLVRVPNAGHSVYFEQPERFNQEVFDFLTEVYPPE